MDQQFITRRDMITMMDTGDPFDLSVVTCNLEKNTGGILYHIKNATKNEWVSAEEFHKQEKLQPRSKMRLKKDPRHYANSTRNILLINGDLFKIHIRLVTTFNNKTVIP